MLEIPVWSAAADATLAFFYFLSLVGAGFQHCLSATSDSLSVLPVLVKCVARSVLSGKCQPRYYYYYLSNLMAYNHLPRFNYQRGITTYINNFKSMPERVKLQKCCLACKTQRRRTTFVTLVENSLGDNDLEFLFCTISLSCAILLWCSILAMLLLCNIFMTMFWGFFALECSVTAVDNTNTVL